MSSSSAFSRIIIEGVYPEINDGRYPAKRCVGDVVEVSADIFMDGHDLLNAVVSYIPPGTVSAIEVPMRHWENDRWFGQFAVEEMGTYRFTIKAWPDLYGSWLRDARRKSEAGQDIGLEVIEGRQLLAALAGADSSAKGEAKAKKPRNASARDNDRDNHRDTASPLRDVRKQLAVMEDGAIAEYLMDDALWRLLTAHAPRQGEKTYERMLEIKVDRKRAEFSAWYEMFPRSQGRQPGKSGTFAECAQRLPAIREMGFDVVYFPPIHPIGSAFRKGKNNALNAGPEDPGSPYAIGSKDGGHKSVHPDLGSLDDFRALVKKANALGMEVALDFAIQASPDHPYLKEHPEWFTRRPDGTIKYAENPPKKYQDIVNFDFQSGQPLWDELRSIVEFWIEQGVTIFRVDNPHTKPFAFWEWMIGGIRETRPDIIFLAEAFTRPKIMYLLAKAGFAQSYSYFTWRNSKYELTEYLTELTQGPARDFFRPNFFPTTPDILPPYLQQSGRPGFMIRLALAATLGGNYGIYSGYELCEGAGLPGREEYADSEKYEYKMRDWDAPGNITAFVTRLNHIRQENPALHQFVNLRFFVADNDNILFYGKFTADKSNAVFVAVNHDYANAQEAHIEMPLSELGIDPGAPYRLDDLLLGHSWEWTGVRQHLRLDPKINPVAIFRIHHS